MSDVGGNSLGAERKRMAIVTRELEEVQSTTGGVWASWRAVDEQGREWRRSRSRYADQTAAQTALDAYDWLPELRDAEADELFEFVRNGGDPDVFVRTDLTIPGWRRRLLRRFARARLMEDEPYMRNVAAWVAGNTVNQIATSLAISTERATTIRNRAIRIRDDIGPDLVLDDADVDTEVN